MSKIETFNKLMIDIGSKAFELQMMIGRFIVDALSEFENKSINLDLMIPVTNDGRFELQPCQRIYYDKANEIVKVKFSNNRDDLVWSEMDISTQEVIINHIHFLLSSKILYNDLSTMQECH